MYKEKFDELWNQTVNGVMYGISAEGMKGKAQINEYLHGFVWEHAWGNKKRVPPERKLLDDLSKVSPQKVMEIESVLSGVTIRCGWRLYVGIAAALAGVILLLALQGALRIAGGVAALGGIGLICSDLLQGSLSPQKAASRALASAKEKCDKILFEVKES